QDDKRGALPVSVDQAWSRRIASRCVRMVLMAAGRVDLKTPRARKTGWGGLRSIIVSSRATRFQSRVKTSQLSVCGLGGWLAALALEVQSHRPVSPKHGTGPSAERRLLGITGSSSANLGKASPGVVTVDWFIDGSLVR